MIGKIRFVIKGAESNFHGINDMDYFMLARRGGIGRKTWELFVALREKFNRGKY